MLSLITHLRHGRGSLELGAYSHVYLLSDGPRRTVKYMEVCVGRCRCCLSGGSKQVFERPFAGTSAGGKLRLISMGARVLQSGMCGLVGRCAL